MRLARIDKGSAPELAIIVDAGAIPIAAHLPDAPCDMIALIAEWDRWSGPLASLAADGAETMPLDTLRLLAPIERPGKIFGIGLNYADHAAESGIERPADQMWFTKAPTAVAGPFDAVRVPRVSEQLDYEAELVVVVGRRCRYADEDEARAAIFGYAAGNDVSVRDWQLRTSQFSLGKSFDTTAPFGPWIVTADAIDPGSLDIECRVNGERRQRSNTHNLIFDPAAMVSHLSQAMTLEPGDLLFSGTPGGVGAVMKPPVWLKDGDVVEVEIEGIGTISNPITAD